MKPSRTAWLTGAEAAAVSILVFLASAVLAVYLLDRVGISFTPWRTLPIALGAALGTFWGLRRDAEWRGGDAVWLFGVFAAVFGGLMWIARPNFLPPGSGPDLTHHLLLIGFIERHWTLVHDYRVEAFLGEMMQYTPGSHALAALAGAWTGTDGLHAVYPLVAAATALKIGFVFLITLRLVAPFRKSVGGGIADAARIPAALSAVLLLGLPLGYVIGSFTHESFLAQVISELFAVGMWWTLAAWDESPGWMPMALFALFGAAAFLTWPVWIGAPLVALGGLILWREQMSLGQRFSQGLIAVLPIAAVAGLYVAGRLGWMRIIGAGGAVMRPSVDEYGWAFLALSALGLIAALFDRRGRTTAIFTGALALEAAALYIYSRQRGNGQEAPYMALKMFYLLVYAQAVLAALAIASIWKASGPWLGRAASRPRVAQFVAWLLVAALGYRVARVSVAAAPAPKPVISQPLFLAGEWAREHVPAACVDYLVGDVFTAYWLHLSVLGNPRMGKRAGDDDTFIPKRAILRWLTPGGLPYAIVDLPALPADVRNELDIVADFGPAAVAKRRGPSSCPTQ